MQFVIKLVIQLFSGRKRSHTHKFSSRVREGSHLGVKIGKEDVGTMVLRRVPEKKGGKAA